MAVCGYPLRKKLKETNKRLFFPSLIPALVWTLIPKRRFSINLAARKGFQNCIPMVPDWDYILQKRYLKSMMAVFGRSRKAWARAPRFMLSCLLKNSHKETRRIFLRVEANKKLTLVVC